MAKKIYGFTVKQLIGFYLLIAVVGYSVIFYVPVNSQGQTLLEILTAPDIEPVACILIFAPVCGVNGETFSNSCFAEAEGVQIAHDGECPVGSNTGEMLVEEPTSAFCRIYPTFPQCQ